MALIHRWRPGALSTTVRPGYVHVWSVSLDVPRSMVSDGFETLSADERGRAARFHFDRDRRRFVCARGALRRILGEYLEIDPLDLSFQYGVHGKPALAGKAAESLSFNVSHSDELALIAVAPPDVELGVDVEAIRSLPDADDIASRYFAPAEVARLRPLPAALREDAFFRCWTRKEAYLKALGDGLARPLDSFEVTFRTDEPVELRVLSDPGETARWTLAALEPASGFAAALVATRGAGKVECSRWTESRAVEARTIAFGVGESV
jgi:4'-phosphopantetheinyl transferase